MGDPARINLDPRRWCDDSSFVLAYKRQNDCTLQNTAYNKRIFPGWWMESSGVVGRSVAGYSLNTKDFFEAKHTYITQLTETEVNS